MRLLYFVYNSRFVQRLLHTDEGNLSTIIDPRWSVLDLGCGSNPPVLRVLQPKQYLGIDGFKPSIEKAIQHYPSSESGNYKFEVRELNDLDFESNEFDAVLCIDVIEHLAKEQGYELIEKAKRWASTLVYISTPNGFLTQDPYDSNSYQEHLSGWSSEDFAEIGFQRIIGGGGLKLLRKTEMQPDQWSHTSGSSMRWRPRFFWSAFSAATQVFSFRFPTLSFQICAVFTNDDE